MRICWSGRSEVARVVVCALGLIAVATLSTPATAIDARAIDVQSSSSLAIQPSALLTIDQNRTSVVDRVVSNWGDALADYGVAFVPEDMVLEHIAAGRLVRVLDDWCTPYTGYHLYYPSRRQSSRALAVVIEALRHRA